MAGTDRGDHTGCAQRDPDAGTPVLMLHATASTGGQWRALAARLAERYRVATPDIAGWGTAGAGRHTLADEAAALMPALAAIEGPFHLVGHSMGGAVAMQLALRMPERIRSLSVIEPVLFHLLRDGAASDRALHAGVAELARRMQDAAAENPPAAASEAAMAQFIDFWGGAGAWDALKPAQRAALAPKASIVADNFAALAAAQFPLAAVARIAAPTLVLMGSESRAETQRIAAKLFGSLPFAALGIVPGAGHMLPVTHGASVNDRLAAHIDAVESGALAVGIAHRNAA